LKPVAVDEDLFSILFLEELLLRSSSSVVSCTIGIVSGTIHPSSFTMYRIVESSGWLAATLYDCDYSFFESRFKDLHTELLEIPYSSATVLNPGNAFELLLCLHKHLYIRLST